MEEFDFGKIIWGVAIVVGLIFRWMANSNSASTLTSDEQGEDYNSDSVEVEPIFEQRKKMHKKRDRVDRGAPPPSVAKSNIEETKEEDVQKANVEFDLRKAVIMSEILTPKFKDE